MALYGRASGWSSRVRAITASRAGGAGSAHLSRGSALVSKVVPSNYLLTDYMTLYILPVVRLHDTSNHYFLAGVFGCFLDGR